MSDLEFSVPFSVLWYHHSALDSRQFVLGFIKSFLYVCSSDVGQIVMLCLYVDFSGTPHPFSHNSLSSGNLLRKLQQLQNPRECCSIWDHLFFFMSGKWLQKALAIMNLILFPLLSKISILYYLLPSVSYSLPTFIAITKNSRKIKSVSCYTIILSIDIMHEHGGL